MNSAEYQRMYEVEDRHWWYVGLHELILAAVERESRRLGRVLRIFDAGCGTGRLCQILSSRGHVVNGCDASEEAIRFCQMRGISTVYRADLNTIDLEAGAYDIITSLDVLYHTAIIDDVAVMQRLGGALRSGGLLLLNLVAHEFLRSSHDIAVHTRERYSQQDLVARLTSSGFDSPTVGYRVCFAFPAIALVRLLRRPDGIETAPEQVVSDVLLPPPPLNAFLLWLLRIENRLWERCTLPFGTSLFAVARKPITTDSET